MINPMPWITSIELNGQKLFEIKAPLQDKVSQSLVQRLYVSGSTKAATHSIILEKDTKGSSVMKEFLKVTGIDASSDKKEEKQEQKKKEKKKSLAYLLNAVPMGPFSMKALLKVVQLPESSLLFEIKFAKRRAP